MTYIRIQASVDLPELDRLELERSLDVLLARMREQCGATTVLAIYPLDDAPHPGGQRPSAPARPPLL